jgi:DNA polymerase-3 subunit gamma/tau
VLDKVKEIRRVTWTLVSVNSTVLDYDAQRVLLGLSSEGLAATFNQGPHAEVVRQGLIEAIGLDARVEGIAAPGGGPGAAPSRPSGSSTPTSAEQLGARRGPPEVPHGAPPAQEWSEAARDAPPDWATGAGDPEAAPPTQQKAATPDPQPPERPTGRSGGDLPRDDDEDLESSGTVGLPVIEKVLGGTVIAVDDDPTH